MKAPTTISELTALARTFTDERDWGQFHTLKNLAMNLGIESAELMQIFVWLNSETTMQDVTHKRTEIEDEVGDILLSLLLFSAKADIDLSAALVRKLQKTAAKYPAASYKGKTKKEILLTYAVERQQARMKQK